MNQPESPRKQTLRPVYVPEPGTKPPMTQAETNVAESAPKKDKPKDPDPTRYGDWEKDGRCVDF